MAADSELEPLPTGQKASRRQRAEARRAEILKAAMATFATRGYRNGSLGEIAEQVGITHAGVLHYFGSKESLLIEVLKYRDEADLEHLEGHRRPEGFAFLEHLVNTVTANIERPGIVQAYAVLSAESVTEGHPGQEWFRFRFEVLRGIIARALAESCPPESAPSAAELDTAASSLIALMDGLQVQWLLDRNVVDMPRALSLVTDALLARWGSERRTAPSSLPG